jgi:predicted SAM-dependent methyltransferase
MSKELITALYRNTLGREPDPQGLAFYIDKMANGFTLDQLIQSFIGSEEFLIHFVTASSDRYGDKTEQRFINLLLQNRLPSILHEVRKQLITTVAPAGRAVLDLGGAHSSDERGALLAVGYPHQPSTLDIIDLPPQDRFYSAGETHKTIRAGATTVRYHYQSMADLSKFATQQFDLVWSGETIEHITYAEAMQMLTGIRRVLKPGGIFALDTPNRTLTEIQVGKDNFTHPEHRYEYRAEELAGLLEQAGFRIVRQLGLVHLPKSAKSREFDAREFVANASINADPANSYVFYIEATPR